MNTLIFFCTCVLKILSLYMSTTFPFDDYFKEVVEKEEKSSHPIMHARLDKAFRMKKKTYLMFLVLLEMTLVTDEDQNIVWTATVEKDESKER